MLDLQTVRLLDFRSVTVRLLDFRSGTVCVLDFRLGTLFMLDFCFWTVYVLVCHTGSTTLSRKIQTIDQLPVA